MSELTTQERKQIALDYHSGDYTWDELREKHGVNNNTINKWRKEYPNITEEDIKDLSNDSSTTDSFSSSEKSEEASEEVKKSVERVNGLNLKVEDTRKQKPKKSKGDSMTENDGDDDGYEGLNPNSKSQVRFFAKKWNCSGKQAKKGIKKLKKKGFSQVNIDENDVI